MSLYDLFTSELVVGTHDDGDIVDELEVGFNEDLELVIRISRNYYNWIAEDMKDPECHMDMVVDKEGAYRLSRRLNVPLAELHHHLAQKVDLSSVDEYFAECQDVWEGFCELRAFLEINKCPYHIRKKYAIGLEGRTMPWK